MRSPVRESVDVGLLHDARAVIEYVHPLIKAAGVPPMSRKIGIMSGIVTSGAHKIKAILPLLNTAINDSAPASQEDYGNCPYCETALVNEQGWIACEKCGVNMSNSIEGA